MRALLLFTFWLLTGATAHAGALSSLSGPAHCKEVALSAEYLDCTTNSCILRENARLTCDHIRVHANTIEIALNDDSSFSGAHAEGNVVLVDKQSVMRCSSITLDAGQITGKISDAVLEVFKSKETAAKISTASSPSHPPGTVTQTVGGDIERIGANEFVLKDASFTLCDCGTGNQPSWRLKSSEIHLNTETRATLWWPRLELNVLGLFMLPIPAPTPVLSLPVQDRAAGLLAPNLTFLRFPLPMVDFPVFLPLGQSVDLTITPGLRFDWGLHRGNDPATWAAPRLGTRVRFAPIEGYRASFEFQWTRDSHYTAARLAQFNASYTGLEDPALLSVAELDPRWGLRDRVIVEAGQTWRIIDGAQWNIKGQWVSDDYYQRDFSVSLEDQVSQYLPTRSRLDWHGDDLLFTLTMDYLQRLNNGNFLDGYRNTSQSELMATQKGPDAQLWLRPQEIGKRVFISSGISASTFGPFLLNFKPRISYEWNLYHQTRLNYLDQIGPFQVDAGITNHLVTVIEKDPSQFTDIRSDTISYPVFEAQFETHLGKRYEKFTHIIQPFMRMRNSLRPGTQPISTYPNHWMQLDTIQQMEIGVSQVWLGFGGQQTSRVELSVSQPLSLEHNEDTMLPSEFNLKFSGLSSISMMLRASMDWSMLDNGPVELRGAISWKPISFLRLYSQYGRMAPGIESLTRSIYELSRPTISDSNASWVHYLRSGMEFTQSKTWKLLYQADILLPRPGDESSGRPMVSNHLIRTGYQSPCECWGLDIIAQMTNPDLSAGSSVSFLDNMTVRVNLTIGDYTLGSL